MFSLLYLKTFTVMQYIGKSLIVLVVLNSNKELSQGTRSSAHACTADVPHMYNCKRADSYALLYISSKLLSLTEIN